MNMNEKRLRGMRWTNMLVMWMNNNTIWLIMQVLVVYIWIVYLVFDEVNKKTKYECPLVFIFLYLVKGVQIFFLI